MESVLLVLPRISKIFESRIPLGLAYIAAVLREKGIPFQVADPTFSSKPMDFIRQKIQEISPDIIGMPAYTYMLEDLKEIIYMIRKVSSSSKIVLGGPHPTMNPPNSLKELNIDAVVIGEGELTFPELIDAYRYGKNLKKVNGIGFKENKKIVITNPRKKIENLDDIPFPLRSAFPFRYLDTVAEIMGSRGCPFNCSFCQPCIRKIFGKRMRYRSPTNVIDEIESLYLNNNCNHFYFQDDTFTANTKWAKKICCEIIKRKLPIDWECNTRVDCVDRDILRIMKKAGCTTIFYGVEHASPEILQLLNKGVTPDKAEKAVLITRETGILAHVNFMIGNPTESYDDIFKIFQFLWKAKPPSIAISQTVPYPDTNLFNSQRKNIIETRYDKNFQRFSWKRQFFRNSLPINELKKVRRQIDFFFRLTRLKYSIPSFKLTYILSDLLCKVPMSDYIRLPKTLKVT